MALLAGVLALPGTARGEHSAIELLTTGPGPDGGFINSYDPYASPDGRRVLVRTDGALVPEDVDNCDQPEFEDFRRCVDVYERFAGATSLVTTGPADQHRFADIGLKAASRDRTRAFFETDEALVLQDTNARTDVYERAAGVTTLVSVGPAGVGTQSSLLGGISEDGSRAFFLTFSALVPEDQDGCRDLYERSAGTTKLVSTGIPSVPSGCATVFWGGSSADGSRVFLITDGAITSEDGDVGYDLYEWRDSQARLVSNGPGRRGDGGFFDVERVHLSRDGRRIFFITNKQLVPEDTESGRGTNDYDVYEHFDGTTQLLVPPVPGDSSPRGSFAAMSEDGSHVFVHTSAALVPEDANAQGDLYERVDGAFRLVTTGPLGNPGDAQMAGPLVSPDARGGITPDGTAVVFASNNRFTPDDTDNVQDIYLRKNGQTTLVSTGPADTGEDLPFRSDLVVLSADGLRVFTQSPARLVDADTDSFTDVYEWHDGVTTLVPHGVPTPGEMHLWATANDVVPDGSRVFVGTTLRLTAQDVDNADDLYAVDLANAPPDCSDVSASPAVLTPANGRLVPVALAGVTDSDGDDVSIEITAVTQDEPTGRTRDAVLSSAGGEVRLRAERDNRSDGRVYRIEFEAIDDNGGTCSGTAKVSVPRKRHKAAIDSAPPSYDSLG